MQTLLRGSYRWEQNVAFFLTMAIGLWVVPSPKAIAGQDNDRLNDVAKSAFLALLPCAVMALEFTPSLAAKCPDGESYY
jgi:hypothetical protein